MKRQKLTELRKLKDQQLAAMLYDINYVLQERYSAAYDEDGPEALETLTSACDEIGELIL